MSITRAAKILRTIYHFVPLDRLVGILKPLRFLTMETVGTLHHVILRERMVTISDSFVLLSHVIVY